MLNPEGFETINPQENLYGQLRDLGSRYYNDYYRNADPTTPPISRQDMKTTLENALVNSGLDVAEHGEVVEKILNEDFSHLT